MKQTSIHQITQFVYAFPAIEATSHRTKRTETVMITVFYVAAILSTIRGLKNNFATPFGENTC